MGHLDNYSDADIAFHTGDVLKADNKTLLRYLSGLTNQPNSNDRTQSRDIIRGLTINNILLQRHVTELQGHITRLDEKNSVTTYAVIALTVASLIGTGIQTWYGHKADKRSEAEAKSTAEKPQTLVPSEARPYSSSVQSSGPSSQGSGAAKK
jgi:hypothetical protein